MIGYVVLAVVCTAGSQLVQAFAARRFEALEATRGTSSESVVGLVTRMLSEPLVIGAYLLLGVGLIFWLMALTKLEISATYPMFAMGFVLTMLSARFVLNERISARGWLGAVIIVLGSVLCNF